MNRKYRKTVIAGNWKMNKTPSETKEFMTKLKAIMPKGRWCDVALCVPAVCIPTAVRSMRETRVGIGAENCNAKASGAYTGEIATNMLVDAGCKYVIIGHSERRAMGETDADINAKVLAALDAGLVPIMCCGETLEQREAGITEEWIAMQIKLGLKDVSEEKIRRVVKKVPFHAPKPVQIKRHRLIPQIEVRSCRVGHDLLFVFSSFESSSLSVVKPIIKKVIEEVKCLHGKGVNPKNELLILKMLIINN